MKFVQLILKEVIKIVATRCQILSLISAKFDFSWGSAPDGALPQTAGALPQMAGALPQTLLGELTALPRPN